MALFCYIFVCEVQYQSMDVTYLIIMVYIYNPGLCVIWIKCHQGGERRRSDGRTRPALLES